MSDAKPCIHPGGLGTPCSHNTPQPPPMPSAGPAAWDLALADLAAFTRADEEILELVRADARERDATGTKKYGQRLTVGDGRDSLVDAYQEALDCFVYSRKRQAEAEIQLPPGECDWMAQAATQTAALLAVLLRRHLRARDGQ